MVTSDKMASTPPASSSASDDAAPAPSTTSNPSSNYGGIDPEVESNLYILPYVSDEGLRSDVTDRRKTIGSPQTDYYPLPTGLNNVTPAGTLSFTLVSLSNRHLTCNSFARHLSSASRRLPTSLTAL